MYCSQDSDDYSALVALYVQLHCLFCVQKLMFCTQTCSTCLLYTISASVQWLVISLAPQNLSLRHKKCNLGSCLEFKSFVLAEQLASGLCLPRALTAALTI